MAESHLCGLVEGDGREEGEGADVIHGCSALWNHPLFPSLGQACIALRHGINDLLCDALLLLGLSNNTHLSGKAALHIAVWRQQSEHPPSARLRDHVAHLPACL